MNVQSTSFVYSGFAALAIAVVSGIASTAISEPRFEHVSSLVEDGDKVDGLSDVVGMGFVGECILLSSQGDNCLTILSQGDDGTVAVAEHIAREHHSPVPNGARKIPADQAATVGGGSICTTKDGRFVFVLSSSSILLFERTTDGTFNFVTYYGESGIVGKTGIKQVGFFRAALSPDQRFLFTNRPADGAIEVIDVNQTAKRMTSLQLVSGLGPCQQLILTPDGRHLYAGSRSSRLLYVFSVSPDTGTVSKVRELTARDVGLSTLTNLRSLEISLDGTTVVATSVLNEGQVVLLDRDLTSGELAIGQVIDHENLGTPDLNYPVCAAFTPDSRTLFLGCSESQCVVVLRKEDASGQFSYLETIKHPTIERPTCLAVNNGFLYVCSRNKGMLAVFRINEKDPARAE